MAWGWFAAGAATGAVVATIGVGAWSHRRHKALEEKFGSLKHTHEYRGINIEVGRVGIEHVAEAQVNGEIVTTKGVDNLMALQRMVDLIDRELQKKDA